MSGPKLSQYLMTLLQREILREQIKRQREAIILEERKKREINEIRNRCIQLRDSVSKLQELAGQSERFADAGCAGIIDVSYLHALCKEALAEVEKGENLGTNRELEQIREAGHNLSTLICRVYTESQKTEWSLGQQESLYRGETMKVISSGFALSFANISDRKALHKNAYLKRIDEELDKLAELTISDDLREKFEQLRKKADDIQSSDFLENFFSISLLPFVKECREYDRLDREYGEDYRMLCLRYEYLARELNREIVDIPFSAQAVSLLLEKIADLEAEELKVKEEAYICQCMEEAMAEMNYTVIGNRNVTKKNGKRFRNVLYRFDEGTAVNVTYASDGQITMELGGVADVDRLPTDAESASLEEDMHSFCDDFYEIEKKLKEKGIEAKHISHLPPEAQFAQIINVSDFEMTEDIRQYEARKGKRRKGGSAEAALHREG